ncbi:hypothetical protein [Pararhodobacter marinus]|uniref:hypothetical protein n=1 Tax=Pararhodobacter marinus TaxID=2184063 RepID=UPI00351271BE
MTFRSSTAAAAVSALFLTMGALPADAQSGRFEGGGTLSNFTAPCLGGGWSGRPQTYVVRYHPANIAWNTDGDTLTFLNDHHGFSVERAGGSFSYAWQPVRHAFIGGPISFRDQDNHEAAEIRLISMWPSNIDETTEGTIRIRGQIRHLGHLRWCRVDFDILVQQS